jgi:hypothetical protein
MISGQINGSDEGSLHWIEISSLSKLKVVEDIPELVERILQARTSGRIFFGKYLYDLDGKRTSNWVDC